MPLDIFDDDAPDEVIGSDSDKSLEITEDPAEVETDWDDIPFGHQRKDTPQYLFEGFDSETEYEEKICRLVDDLLVESKTKWRDLKQRWGRAMLRLEMIESLALKVGIDKSDLPITPQAIEESIAIKIEGLFRPEPKARSAEQDQIVSTLATFFDRELEANNFDFLMAKTIFNQETMFTGIVKMIFEEGHPGPYTMDGRIIMKRVDTRYFWPDPLAKGDTFSEARYWIFAEPEDTADVRRRFPGKGFAVQPESEYSLNRTSKEQDVEPVGDYAIGRRMRCLVKECWIRDDRECFVPILDEEGNEIPIEGTDEVLGKWEKKYPNGRLIITSGNVLLEDKPNPFPHGEPPYTLFPSRVAGEIFSWSNVELLGRIEDKINRLHKDMIRNARVNMNSPWIAERHAFDSPKKFNMLTQDPGLVLPIAPGARVERLPPAELPQFIFPLLAWLRNIFDDLLGVQGIMRGQLEKGSQLSADTVEGLQASSSARLRFRVRLLENSLKRLGHQLEWMIRTYYPSEMQITETDPRTGKTIELNWTAPPKEMGSFEIGIETGSGLPGTREKGAPFYLKLWQLDLIPRMTVLQALRVPNAEKLAQQMDQDDLRQAALGVMQRRNKNGAPGRKNMSVTI